MHRIQIYAKLHMAHIMPCHGGADKWWRTPVEDDKGNQQFKLENPQNLVFVIFLFHILFFITEDRKTISSPPLQAAKVKEVAYVKKIIVTRGTRISCSSQ